MSLIVLSDEQARVLMQADGPVELRDERGHLLASVPVWSQDEIAEARRRLASDQKGWSSEKVQKFLARLEEIRKQEGMDEGKLREVMARFRAGELA